MYAQSSSSSAGAGLVTLLLLVGVMWALPVVLGYKSAEKKGRSTGKAIAITLIFGWLGFIVVACLSDNARLRREADERADRERRDADQRHMQMLAMMQTQQNMNQASPRPEWPVG